MSIIYNTSVCQICTKTYKSALSLTRHFTKEHKISSEEYFLKYIGEVGKCKLCLNPTRFICFPKGYAITCGHVCGAKMHRANLKADPIKFANFTKKVSENQTYLWKEDPYGHNEKIRDKIQKSLVETHKNITPEDKVKKFSRYYNCDESTIERLNKEGAKQLLKINGVNQAAGYMKSHKGKYIPKNPSKYKGNISQIFFRSFLEFRFMKFLDNHPDILRWNSEEVIIPYKSPIDGRRRRYFPDFWIEKVDVDGKKEQVIVEIKPSNQTMEPKPKKRMTRQYLNEVTTWGVNSAKWEAAKAFCEKRNMKFMIVTEKDITGYKY